MRVPYIGRLVNPSMDIPKKKFTLFFVSNLLIINYLNFRIILNYIYFKKKLHKVCICRGGGVILYHGNEINDT